jgi:hypothetical protein
MSTKFLTNFAALALLTRFKNGLVNLIKSASSKKKNGKYNKLNLIFVFFYLWPF